MKSKDEAALSDALIRACADPYSIRILIETINEARSANELSHIDEIPLATVYRRINRLKEMGLLRIERVVLAGGGRKSEFLRSSLKSFNIHLSGSKLAIHADSNDV